MLLDTMVQRMRHTGTQATQWEMSHNMRDMQNFNKTASQQMLKICVKTSKIQKTLKSYCLKRYIFKRNWMNHLKYSACIKDMSLLRNPWHFLITSFNSKQNRSLHCISENNILHPFFRWKLFLVNYRKKKYHNNIYLYPSW